MPQGREVGSPRGDRANSIARNNYIQKGRGRSRAGVPGPRPASPGLIYKLGDKHAVPVLHRNLRADPAFGIIRPGRTGWDQQRKENNHELFHKVMVIRFFQGCSLILQKK